MAMNKREQAEMEDLRRQLRLAKALRWTEEVLPDVLIPETLSSGLAKGFLFNDYIGSSVWGPRVVPACSNSVHHAFGRDDETDAQGGRNLYSTRLLALRGLRHAIEKQCAGILAKVDADIEAEQKGGAA